MSRIILPTPNDPPILVSRLQVDPMCQASAHNGLLRFSFILTTVGKNRNGQVFLGDEISLPEIYRGPVNQAIDQDHDQGFKDIRGSIYDSQWIPPVGNKTGRIKTFGVIFESLYPDVAFKVRLGAQEGWAATSMEAWPHPLEQVGTDLIIHMPEFIGAGLVRFPGNVESIIDDVDGIPSTPTPDRSFLERVKTHEQKVLAMRQGLGLVMSKKV